MYELSGEDPHLYEWIAEQTDSAIVDCLLEWLPRFAADPEECATAIKYRVDGSPCLTARVPGTDAFVDYTVIDSPKKIIVILRMKTRREFLG